MTSYYVEMTFDMGGPFDDEMESHLDEVAEEFANLSDVDGDVGVNTESGRVDLCMTVNAADRSEALMRAFTAARTAVHAAGGATSSWDGWLPKLLEDDDYQSSVKPSTWLQRDCPA